MLYQGVPEYRLSRDLIRAEVDQILSLGVELKLELAARPRLHGRRSAPQRVRGRLSRARRVARPRPEHSRQRSRRRHQRRRLPAERQSGLPRRRSASASSSSAAATSPSTSRGRRCATRSPEERPALPGGAEQLLHTWGYDNAFIDAARTALRLGARHVQLVSLESRAQMPAHPDEVREAEEEGITLSSGRRAEGDSRPRRTRRRPRDAGRRVAVRRQRPIQSDVRAEHRAAVRRRHDHPGGRPAARHAPAWRPTPRSRSRRAASWRSIPARSPRRCPACTAAATWRSARGS